MLTKRFKTRYSGCASWERFTSHCLVSSPCPIPVFLYCSLILCLGQQFIQLSPVAPALKENKLYTLKQLLGGWRCSTTYLSHVAVAGLITHGPLSYTCSPPNTNMHIHINYKKQAKNGYFKLCRFHSWKFCFIYMHNYISNRTWNMEIM